MARKPRPGGWRVTGPQAFLLAASFLITLGSFAVLPYMSVLLHQRLGLGLGTVGIVLAVASLVQFSGGVASGALAARIGLRATMLAALAVRTAGFAAFVPGMTSPALAVGALFLVSCGAALYLPANKAYLVEGAGEADRPRLLSASGSAFNAGIALGPPAAAPLVMGSPTVLFSCVTALFALVGTGHALLPPAVVRPVADGAREATGDAGLPQRHEDGLPPFAVTVLSVYVFMFFQHYLALYAVPRTSAGYYGAVLAGYACLLVVAQPLLSGRIAALSYRDAVKAGFGSMAAGTAVIAYGGYAGIGAGAALMCVGEVVLFLKNDLEALARSTAAPATVFGRQRLAAGLGAFGSAVVGGQVYAAAEAMGSARGFWLAVCVQALLLPVLLASVVRRRRSAAGPGARRRTVIRRAAAAIAKKRDGTSSA
ncbi:MFS transporter [Streptomyces sp. TRM S81-3]|uniref:MFS transporter n=1 Tax=Streptomyces griseicoloratus TaxID=2752516 RepID=A0A926LAQ2_9ACTN|nr:MFS transporter [Streptomyces griseicoloratus]MBD0424484.1 MFS transporter [Streptomyces griseicoloratus]